MILVFGGIGSGKSAYAEKLVEAYQCKKAYLATMKVYDEEGRKKVEKHRKMREGKFDRSIELPTDVANADVEKDELVLLECMSNLLANEMFKEDLTVDADTVAKKISADIKKLNSKVCELIIVGNDVFMDKGEHSLEVKAYIKALKEIQKEIAKEAKAVVEVIYGLPYERKDDIF